MDIEYELVSGRDQEMVDSIEGFTLDKRLLEQGWAGMLTWKGATFIAQNLAISPELRRDWEFRGWRRYPLVLIAERAYPEDPAEARRNMENQLAARRRRLNGRNDGSHVASDQALAAREYIYSGEDNT